MFQLSCSSHFDQVRLATKSFVGTVDNTVDACEGKTGQLHQQAEYLLVEVDRLTEEASEQSDRIALLEEVVCFQGVPLALSRRRCCHGRGGGIQSGVQSCKAGRCQHFKDSCTPSRLRCRDGYIHYERVYQVRLRSTQRADCALC